MHVQARSYVHVYDGTSTFVYVSTYTRLPMESVRVRGSPGASLRMGQGRNPEQRRGDDREMHGAQVVDEGAGHTDRIVVQMDEVRLAEGDGPEPLLGLPQHRGEALVGLDLVLHRLVEQPAQRLEHLDLGGCEVLTTTLD